MLAWWIHSVLQLHRFVQDHLDRAFVVSKRAVVIGIRPSAAFRPARRSRIPELFRPSGRRHFLASVAVCALGACLPPSSAHAATTPPSSPGAETLQPGQLSPSSTATIAETSLVGTAAAEQHGDTSIRPFNYRATDEELADLKRRIKATKWPHRETVNDTSQGVRLATMQKLADYWANHHDWRRAEAQIFSYPNFVTNVDGLDIHFVHVKSKHPNALPVIITHGWPGSIIEQLKIIGPLIDPTAHGGAAADAFDVVIPSLPGYGFSGKPTSPGWGRTAHCQGVGGVDEPDRLQPLRGPGRRLGKCDQRSDGVAAAARPACHPHQHVSDAS
jgi:hypothetical protein